MHDENICNSCIRKQKWKRQTGGQKRDFKGVLSEEIISENTGDEDLSVHLQNQKERIAQRLRETLAVFKYAPSK